MKKQMRNATPALAIATLLITALVTACGGGGNNNSGSNNSGGGAGPSDPPPPPSGRYLFYQAGTNGALMAIDPATPSSPIQVTPAISSTAIAAIGHGTFNLSAKTVSDLHTRTIVYAQDGKLWKVNAFKSGSLAITQVSSETGAANICQTVTTSDFANHDNAAYVYELAGDDNDCNTLGDNPWRMVRVGMDSNTAPFNARRPITSLDSSTNGTHIGWLVADDTAINRYTADFSRFTPVLDAPGGQPVTLSAGDTLSYYGPVNIAQELLRLNDAIGTYTVDSNVWTAKTSVKTRLADFIRIRENGYLYYADFDTLLPQEITLYRLKIAETNTPVVLGTINNYKFPNDGLTLRLTTNKLVYSYYDSQNAQSSITAVNKADGTGKIILTGAPLPGTIRSFSTAGNRLYYSVDQTTRYQSDGTDEQYGASLASRDGFSGTTSAWIGVLQANQITIGNRTASQSLFLLESFSAATGFSGGSLTRYDAATATKGAVLGTIDQDIKEVVIEGNRTITLANGLRNDGHNDIFFVDIDTANSLVRITDDTADDIIIDAYH